MVKTALRQAVTRMAPLLKRLLACASIGALGLGAASWYTGRNPLDLVFPPAKIKASRWPGKLILPSDHLTDPPGGTLSPTPHGPKKVSSVHPVEVRAPLG